MALTELLSVLSPPNMPLERPDPANWQEVEKALGTQLPEDYKQFLEVFGTGRIDRFLWVYSPVSKNPFLNLFNERDECAATAFALKRDFGLELLPFPAYPELGGLLPWAGTDNGDRLYWLTGGKPDAWPIVVAPAREPEYQRFSMSMTSFLARTLRKRLVCQIFPENFPTEAPRFSAEGAGS